MRPETVDTAAATVGSSMQVRWQNSNPMAATVEDYDGDEDEQNIDPLPKNSKELLLLKEGEMEIPRETRDKRTEKQSKTTVNNRKKHAQSKNTSESTGSDWVKDPRMPHELNELTSLIWKSRMKEPVIEQYRHPGLDEMSNPVDFMTYARLEENIKKAKRTERPFRLPTIDESMASIERLKEKYKPVRKQVRKGEEKTSKPSAKDVIRLRQQWYNEFVDILEGTKEELHL